MTGAYPPYGHRSGRPGRLPLRSDHDRQTRQRLPWARVRARAIIRVAQETQAEGGAIDRPGIAAAVKKVSTLYYRAWRCDWKRSLGDPAPAGPAPPGEPGDRVTAVSSLLDCLLDGGSIEPRVNPPKRAMILDDQVQLVVDTLESHLGKVPPWDSTAVQDRSDTLGEALALELAMAEAAEILATTSPDTEQRIELYGPRVPQSAAEDTSLREQQEDPSKKTKDPYAVFESLSDPTDPSAIEEHMVGSERLPVGWAMLIDEELLAALYQHRTVLPLRMPRIGHALNLITAELICLVGPTQVAVGLPGWLDCDAPTDPLRACTEHPHPIQDKSKSRQRWNEAVYAALNSLARSPACLDAAGVDSEPGQWLDQMLNTQMKKLPGPDGIIGWVSAPADGETRSSWMYRLYVASCVTAVRQRAQRWN